MIQGDILFAVSGDIAIVGGDLVIDNGTIQHQYDLLISRKKDWLFDPAVGVGVEDYLDDETSASDLFLVIKAEFERDGMEVTSINIREEDFANGVITTDTLKINATYQ